MAQHELNITANRSVWLDANDDQSGRYDTDYLRVGDYIISGTDIFTKYAAVLGFDFDQIPQRKKIIDASVFLYPKTSASLSSPFRYWHKRNNWDEENATYTNFIYLTHPTTDRGPYQTQYSGYSAGMAHGFNVGASFITELRSFMLGNNRDYNTVICDFYSTRADSGVRPYLKVTYEDVPPDKPTLLTPIGVYKDSASVVRFEWKYNSSVGGEQKKFDLQWSTNQLDWTTISETTENTFYDMPADTLPAGNVYWRVRCYNEYDENSGYSDIQSFYAIGAPAAPGLNDVPTDTARPVITWSAFSQQVYQLQVLSGGDIAYDSGIVPGINIRSHKITVWLTDGEYTVQMRIKNEYDMWSDWGAATVTISTVKPDKPTLTLQQSAHGVEISATGLVYRSEYDKDNFICIGTATGAYHDNTVASGREYKYFVRAVSENDTFADSDVKFIQSKFNYALIAPISDLTNVFTFSHGLNGPPKRTCNRQSGGATVQYAGRKYPVWEPTEHISTGLSLQFYLETWDKVKAFTEIYDLNNTVLYRDAKGRKIYGTLSNLSVNDDILGYVISFVINQVDYDEEV